MTRRTFPAAATRLLPATLDLDAHLAAQPPSFAPFSRDALAQLLHLVATLPLTNRKLANRLRHTDGYLPLSAVFLKRWLPNYAAYLRYACATGLLETDNWFVVGGKCRSYRLGARFRNAGGASRAVVLRDPAFLRRWYGRYQQGWGERQVPWATYVALLDWLCPNSSPLRIRQAEALAFSEADRARQLASLDQQQALPIPAAEVGAPAERAASNGLPAPVQLTTQTELVLDEEAVDEAVWGELLAAGTPAHLTVPDRQEVKPHERYWQRFTTIQKLAERDFGPIFDRQGRLHTALTNASGNLRQFIYAEGFAPLWALDLRNSQIYLATLLLRPDFYAAPFTRGRRGSRVPLTLQVEGQRQHAELQRCDPGFFSTVRRLLPPGGSHGAEALPPDVEQFRAWASTGDFYAQAQTALNQALGQELITAEGRKQQLLKILFSRNSTRTRGKAAFAQLFPTVAAVFTAYKAADHRVLPCLLQAVEAHLFLKVLAPRLRQRFPEMCLFTVHDSVVVPADHLDRVEALLVQVLTAQVGLTPQFRRTAWGSDPDWAR
ncbi:hypothetical protein [Hymenobacter armeniacus]|uniref:DNA-directed DNA polymerase family A palm domain-containing protein n=1 Tax=Hymenobacter armeniacus TaxID=2771358 RepID=A0ABR8JTW9_9BACT|nr:hypothetical protein [Hymenobacter armeniacus]MBD2722206.1 hypothetical protein [Hymenobacter armeniacus]